MDSGYDVAVVGGGIVGCAMAHGLAQRGRRCVLLEAQHLASGASGASFAWLNATSKGEAEDYHRLNADGVAGWIALAAVHGEHPIGLDRCGNLEWSTPDTAPALDALRSRFQRLRAWGHPAIWVERRELLALEPHMHFPEGAEGIFAPGDGWLDVPRAVAFLAGRVRALGGEVREHTPVTGLRTVGGRTTGVDTAAGPVHADRVVLCAGHRVSGLLDPVLGPSQVPVGAVPGLLLTTPPGSARRWVQRIVYAETERAVQVRPDAGGSFMLGADETDDLLPGDGDPAAVRRAAADLLARGDAALPGLAAAAPLDACRWRVGVRPMPEDRRSLVGPVPGVDGLYLVATHSGVTLSVAIAPLLAEALETGTLPAKLAPFDLARCQPRAAARG